MNTVVRILIHLASGNGGTWTHRKD